MLRRLFRYKATSIFFVVGQMIVYFAVIGALGIYNMAFDKERDRLDAICDYRISMEVVTMTNSDIVSSAAKEMNKGNLLLSGGIYVSVMEVGYNTLAEIIIKQNEEMPYEIVEGRLPGSVNGKKGIREVALGRDKYKYAYEENGKKYITLDNEAYEVVGVIGSARSDYWDYKVVLHIDCLGEQILKKVVAERQYELELTSNTGNIDESYSVVYRNIMNKDSNSIITAKKKNSTGESTIEKTLGKENVKVNIIVYIFCLFCCMAISEFWIMQRKKDLAIKKAFGMSDTRIIMEILGNIVGLSVVAFIGFLIIYGLCCLIMGMSYELRFNGFMCLMTAVAVIITVAVTMIYPIYKVFRFKPVDVIGGTE